MSARTTATYRTIQVQRYETEETSITLYKGMEKGQTFRLWRTRQVGEAFGPWNVVGIDRTFGNSFEAGAYLIESADATEEPPR